MALVVVMGTAGVVYSREQRNPDLTPPRAPQIDHWHTAIGFYICGTFAPHVQSENDPLGIHTHNDGVVHTHPFNSRAAGDRARLRVFFDAVGAEIDENELQLPGHDAKRNGEKCEGRDARVRTRVWDTRAPSDQGRIYEGDPGDIRLKDNQLITIGFVPDGVELPRPPSEPQLDNLTDVPGATTTVPAEPGATTTTAPGAPPTSAGSPTTVPATTTPPPATSAP